MQNIDALAKATDKKGVTLHQVKNRGFGACLDNPKTSLRNVLGLRAQGASDKYCLLVLIDPCDMRLEMLCAKLTVTWLVGEQYREQHFLILFLESIKFFWMSGFFRC